MGVFFKLWKTNVKKISKHVDISDSVNPIGKYLADLKEYLQKGKDDVKMLSEEEMSFKKAESVNNEDFTKKFDLIKLLNQLSTESKTETSELNLMLLSRNLDASKDSIMFNRVLDGLLFCLTNRQVSLYNIQNEVKP